jgi:hypothetical protein
MDNKESNPNKPMEMEKPIEEKKPEDMCDTPGCRKDAKRDFLGCRIYSKCEQHNREANSAKYERIKRSDKNIKFCACGQEIHPFSAKCGAEYCSGCTNKQILAEWASRK